MTEECVEMSVYRKIAAVVLTLAMVFVVMPLWDMPIQAASLKPILYIDSPKENAVINQSGSTVPISISGWAVAASQIVKVTATFDGKAATNSIINIPRPDIAKAYPTYQYATTSGFKADMLVVPSINAGYHTVTITATTTTGTTFHDSIQIWYVKSSTVGNTAGNIANEGLAAQQGNWIYYNNNNDGGILYKIKTDGSGKAKLNDDCSENINVVGDWIYYDNCSDGYKIYKIKTDGSGKTKLNDDISLCINIVGNWVYYENRSDGDKIYKIKIDGSGKAKLNDDSSQCINVVDDWVYYENCSHGGKIYKIKTDGSGKTQLNADGTNINVIGSWIYYEIQDL
jgi:hypothetical protein